MCVSVRGYVHMTAGAPDLVIAGSYELLSVDARSQIQSFGRVVSFVNYWTISVALVHIFSEIQFLLDVLLCYHEVTFVSYE